VIRDLTDANRVVGRPFRNVFMGVSTMFKAIRRMAGKFVLVVLGIAVWQLGGLNEFVMRQFRMASAWAATDGTSDLKQYGMQLEKNLESLEAAKKGLEAQQKDLASKEADRAEELARLDHLLACFRAACLTGVSEGFPQKVFTRSYTEEQIRTTVQDLLDRRRELVQAGKSPAGELSDALARMDQRIIETKRHIENMPVYESLAVAGNAAGRSTTIMESMTTCLQDNQTLLSGSISLSGSEDGESSESSDLLSRMDASEFLKPTEQEVKAPVVESSAPTVSELQDALRNLVLQSREIAK